MRGSRRGRAVVLAVGAAVILAAVSFARAQFGYGYGDGYGYGYYGDAFSLEDFLEDFEFQEVAPYELLQRCPGCDQQVIEPTIALAAFGGLPGGNGWRQAVLASTAYRNDTPRGESCTAAVRSLFQLVCGGDESCEIEARYDDLCLNTQSAAVARSCVEVVDLYQNNCMGGCPYDVWWTAGAGALTTGSLGYDGVQCSASVFRAEEGDRFLPPLEFVGVTAPHCLPTLEVSTRVVLRGVTLWDIDPPFDGFANAFPEEPPNFALVEPPLPDNRRQGWLTLGEPAAFVETVFMGFNSLIDSRNRVNDRFRIVESGFSPFFCDASPLCTIVKIDGDTLVHTCQTTRGGSGGALIQRNPQGSGYGGWLLVGINNGSPDRGLVVGNEGYVLRPR